VAGEVKVKKVKIEAAASKNRDSRFDFYIMHKARQTDVKSWFSLG